MDDHEPHGSTFTTEMPRRGRESHTANWSWAGYAAALWAFAFAAVSFYWAAGGRVGVETLAESIQQQAAEGDPGLTALTWATGALKALAGVVALALVQSWGGRFPRWLLLAAGWGAGCLLALYGAAGLVEAALIEAGVLDVPESMGRSGVRWALLLWKPVWLIGGVLFLLATAAYQRRTRYTGE